MVLLYEADLVELRNVLQTAVGGRAGVQATQLRMGKVELAIREALKYTKQQAPGAASLSLVHSACSSLRADWSRSLAGGSAQDAWAGLERLHLRGEATTPPRVCGPMLHNAAHALEDWAEEESLSRYWRQHLGAAADRLHELGTACDPWDSAGRFLQSVGAAED